MKDLYEILPNALQYIATGYIFVCLYEYLTFYEKEKDIVNCLSKSLIIGYVICKVMNGIPWNINDVVDTIGIFCTSAITAYVFSKIKNSKSRKIYDGLKIRRTPNDILWNDLTDNRKPYFIEAMDEEGNIYKGGAYLIEENQRTPYIVLAGYEYRINNIQNDATKCNNEVIVLDSSKMKYIKFIYDNESEFIEDIESFTQQ